MCWVPVRRTRKHRGCTVNGAQTMTRYKNACSLFISPVDDLAQREQRLDFNCLWGTDVMLSLTLYSAEISVSQEPQCARFRRVFTCSPIVKIHITQCILPGFVSSVYMSHCRNDETGWNALCYVDLSNKRTGKDATKPCALGLLGHSGNGIKLICKYVVYSFNLLIVNTYAFLTNNIFRKCIYYIVA